MRMKELLKSIDKDWNELSDDKKNGVYIKRQNVQFVFTPNEIKDLPEKHHARSNPDMVIERTELVEITDSIYYADDKAKFIWD
jgi:hypothetical protein